MQTHSEFSPLKLSPFRSKMAIRVFLLRSLFLLNCACVRLCLTRGLNARRRSAAADISACVRYASHNGSFSPGCALSGNRFAQLPRICRCHVSRVTPFCILKTKCFLLRDTSLSVVRTFCQAFFKKASTKQPHPPSHKAAAGQDERVARHFAVRRTDCLPLPDWRSVKPLSAE